MTRLTRTSAVAHEKVRDLVSMTGAATFARIFWWPGIPRGGVVGSNPCLVVDGFLLFLLI